MFKVLIKKLLLVRSYRNPAICPMLWPWSNILPENDTKLIKFDIIAEL